jgi:hypothetical protein
MIVVTGTKRSGTSMWMQILKAAGFTVLGDAFPRDWGETIREANPGGFYESPLRHGIYYATNPHPQSGAFLAPGETRDMVVKVFALGLAKSDLAYLDRVLATMRHWREYEASITRLYAMEREGKLRKAERTGESSAVVPEYDYLSPVLEWWNDNFTLIRDALVRRYPLHMISYASVLRDPERVIEQALGWLGGGNKEAALAAVQEDLRTQSPEVLNQDGQSELTSKQIEVFDELYARIDTGTALDGPFIDRLNETHDELEPLIERATMEANRQRRSARRDALRSRDKDRA